MRGSASARSSPRAVGASTSKVWIVRVGSPGAPTSYLSASITRRPRFSSTGMRSLST